MQCKTFLPNRFIESPVTLRRMSSLLSQTESKPTVIPIHFFFFFFPSTDSTLLHTPDEFIRSISENAQRRREICASEQEREGEGGGEGG